jgi:hypothetical protein
MAQLRVASTQNKKVFGKNTWEIIGASDGMFAICFSKKCIDTKHIET